MAIVEREYKVNGTGRLLLQADVLADPLHPAKREIEKLTSLKGKDKTPDVHERIGRLEWMANLYWDADMGPVLPADNIMKCIREGAMKNKNGKQVEQAVFVDDHAAIRYDGPRDRDALYQDSKFVLRKTVVVNRARCIRVRPVFSSWSATFRVTVDTSIMDLGKLDTAVATAGKLVGIGTWRPRFGRFLVESAGAPGKA